MSRNFQKTLPAANSPEKMIYSIFAPDKFRSNENYTLNLTVHDSQRQFDEPTVVEVLIEDKNNPSRFQIRRHVAMNPDMTKLISIPIGDVPVGGDYALVVKGITGIKMEHKTRLLLKTRRQVILIQTDKAIYKPKDVIRFRVFVLDVHLKPIAIGKNELKIDITDPCNKQIFTEECSLNENQQAADHIQFGKMRRSLNKNRKKGLPTNPTTPEEVKSFLEDPKMFPVFYVLMTRKTQISYEHLLKYIKDTYNLQPKKFMCDYERGLRNAIRKTFPGVPVKGCWFHYCQALRKKAAQIPGFFAEIWANQRKRQLFHKFLSLPLLKENHILNAFRILKAEILNLENPFEQFLLYFERQWIRREGPQNICVYLELNRTNNLSESYNCYLKSIIKLHGSFYDFISVLLKEEKRIARDYRVQMGGGDRVFVDRRRKYATRDEHIKLVQQRFEDELIDIPTFLSQITFADNTGAVNRMDTYEDGDENDNEDEVDEDAEEGDEGSVEEEGAAGGSEVPNVRHETEIRTLQTQLDELRAANLCIICLIQERNTMIQPCGHVRTCRQCTDILQSVRYDNDGVRVQSVCPLCRGQIVSAERAYL